MAEAANIMSIAIWRRGVPAVLAACALLTIGPGGDLRSFAQQPPAPQQQTQQQFTVEQINQLVAPIALYPDNLLGQVLAASTYPLEVVVAARWSQSNQNVTGKALEDAMQLQSWDPSVKALCAVPQVLAMMSEKVEWTQQLGAAYQAQPDDIAVAIQNLRARADASGNLKETNQVKVRRVAAPPPPTAYLEPPPPEYIYIEPYDPAYLFVPVYDPWVVYGVWPWPTWRPWYWYPPGYVGVGIIGFGAPIFVGAAIWANYSWSARRVQVNVVNFNSFNRTRIVSTGGNMNWTKNSQQFSKVAITSKTGPGGQQFLNNKVNIGNNNKVNLGNNNKVNLGNKVNVGGQNTLSKTNNPQGIASINQGNKTKINTGNTVNNTVRNNVTTTQKLNVNQNFRPNNNFRPNVGNVGNRVNVQNYKKK
jgi:uncharacterized protein DUF3300